LRDKKESSTINIKNSNFFFIQDNSIIILTQKLDKRPLDADAEKPVEKIIFIFLLKSSFSEFIEIVINSSGKKELSKNILSSDAYVKEWRPDGFIQFYYSSSWIDALVKSECDEKISKKIEKDLRRAVTQQIFRVMSDVYYVKIFHTTQDVILNPVSTTNMEEAIVGITETYLENLTNHTKQLTTFANYKFYSFFNLSRIRQCQDTIRLAFGDMLLADSFVNFFWDCIPRTSNKRIYCLMRLNKSTNPTLKSKNDNSHHLKNISKSELIRRFGIARDAINTLSKRIESRWSFVVPITSCSSLFMLMTLYILINDAKIINKEIYFFANIWELVSVMPWANKMLLAISLALFIPTMGILILSFFSLYIRDVYEAFSKWLLIKRVRYKIKRIEHPIFRKYVERPLIFLIKGVIRLCCGFKEIFIPTKSEYLQLE